MARQLVHLPAPTSTPTLDSIAHFVNAVKLFLDESDIISIDTLASRMSPFRIDFQQGPMEDPGSIRPVLVLENEPPSQPELLGSTHLWNTTNDMMESRIRHRDTPCQQRSCSLIVNEYSSYHASSLDLTNGNEVATEGIATESGYDSGSGQDTELANSDDSVSSSANTMQTSIGSSPCRTPIQKIRTEVVHDAAQEVALRRAMCSTASLPQPAPNAESPAPRNVDSVNETGQTIQRDADNSIQNAATPRLVTVAKACVRSDFVQFLEMNLSRWCQHGLWGRERYSGGTVRVDKYEKLQTAYSYICQLDARMKDDAIRSRMAMVFLHLEFEKTCRECRSSHPGEAKTKTIMGRGRGKISSMIDGILENTHPSWRFADAREKGEMRTNFHNQKRYGKRWWTLVNTLGCGILLLCSSSLVGMIRNTTVTATTLAAIARVIQVVHSDLMSILHLANPIAEKLFQNHGYQDYDTKQLLEKLRAFGSISVGQARANGGNAGDEWRQ
ncbi:hypothetical protein MANI_028488 [Metarhizium anisopliae]|nr:hypothetical protein MANI_028488 [Metarhizium anisopliae]